MDDPDEKARYEAATKSPDWFLQNLVAYINDTLAELPITMSVGGLLVSGQIISGRTYFDAWASELATAYRATGANALADEAYEQISKLGHVYPAKPRPTSGGTNQYEPAAWPPIYIHLKDARLFTGPQQVPENRGVLWRGRIARVDGFFLGNLSPGEVDIDG